MSRVWSCFLLLIVVVPVFADTQRADLPNVWGIWGGVGLSTLTIGGLTRSEQQGRGLTLVALHYGRVLIRRPNVSLLYTVDALPAVIATGSEVLETNGPGPPNITRKTVYGLGANPIGFQLNFGHARIIKPFAFMTAGFLHFNHAFPNPRSTRWNFSAEGGGGLQFLLNGRKSISVGYRLHHISNANIGKTNPTLNTNVLFFGLNFFR